MADGISKKKAMRGITVQVRNTLALPKRAEMTSRLLFDLKKVFGEVFADENFLTLLQAESAIIIPAYLRGVLDEAKNRHDLA